MAIVLSTHDLAVAQIWGAQLVPMEAKQLVLCPIFAYTGGDVWIGVVCSFVTSLEPMTRFKWFAMHQQNRQSPAHILVVWLTVFLLGFGNPLLCLVQSQLHRGSSTPPAQSLVAPTLGELHKFVLRALLSADATLSLATLSSPQWLANQLTDSTPTDCKICPRHEVSSLRGEGAFSAPPFLGIVASLLLIVLFAALFWQRLVYPPPLAPPRLLAL